MQANTSLPIPSAVLWDMDGTLIDQTVGITRCYADVIESMGFPKPDSDTIRRSLGGPLASTMALFIPKDQLEDATLRFRARFPEIMYAGMLILPGGFELIESFYAAGIAQAIFTNKHGETAREVSKHIGLNLHIPTCIGNKDTKWHKPQPELTHYVLQQINSSAKGACMIGDSPTDIETAKNAGLACYCVATGAHSIDELNAAGADATFSKLENLKQAFGW